MKGRKPIPNNVRFMRGQAGHRPARTHPEPPKGLPAPPKHLGAIEREAWRRLGGHLLSLGLMSPLFREQLELAVCAYADGRRARAVLVEKGETYETRNQAGATMVRARPERAMVNDSDRRLASALAALGATPTSIPRLMQAPGNPSDKAIAEILGW